VGGDPPHPPFPATPLGLRFGAEPLLLTPYYDYYSSYSCSRRYHRSRVVRRRAPAHHLAEAGRHDHGRCESIGRGQRAPIPTPCQPPSPSPSPPRRGRVKPPAAFLAPTSTNRVCADARRCVQFHPMVPHPRNFGAVSRALVQVPSLVGLPGRPRRGAAARKHKNTHLRMHHHLPSSFAFWFQFFRNRN
jgi:hypothetical protein